MKIKESKESQFWQETFSMTVDVTSEYLIKIAILQFPFLAIPVVKQIFSFIVKNVISKVESEGVLQISFTYIDIETNEKKDAYVVAVNNLKEILASDKTVEEKNEAIQETKKRLRTLIRMPVK
jgi:hypothetical protein